MAHSVNYDDNDRERRKRTLTFTFHTLTLQEPIKMKQAHRYIFYSNLRKTTLHENIIYRRCAKVSIFGLILTMEHYLSGSKKL